MCTLHFFGAIGNKVVSFTGESANYVRGVLFELCLNYGIPSMEKNCYNVSAETFRYGRNQNEKK